MVTFLSNQNVSFISFDFWCRDIVNLSDWLWRDRQFATSILTIYCSSAYILLRCCSDWSLVSAVIIFYYQKWCLFLLCTLSKRWNWPVVITSSRRDWHVLYGKCHIIVVDPLDRFSFSVFLFLFLFWKILQRIITRVD